MKHLIAYLLPALFAPAACTENPAPVAPPPAEPADYVRLEQKLFTVECAATAVDITFEASGEWTLTADGWTGWCRPDKTGGPAGTNTIRVEVDENKTYDERNAALYIATGRARDLVTITQKQVGALMLTSNKVEVEAAGATFRIELKASVGVSYEIEAAAQGWLEPATAAKTTRALTDHSFTFRALPNTAFTPRQGTIIIRGEGGPEERVSVYQAGEAPTLVLNDRNRLVVDSEGGDLQVEVKSNVPYELVLPRVDWVSENITRSVSTFTHYLAIRPNTAYDPREAQLVVRSTDGQLADTVVIWQMQQGAIVLARDRYEVSGEEGVFGLSLSTNVDITTHISESWIVPYTGPRTRGLEERELLFSIERNPSAEPRTAIITFSYKDITQRVTITQAGRRDHLRLLIAHSESTFAPLQLWGSHFRGTIDWGDGSTSDIYQGHTYTSAAPRTVTLDAMGVDSLCIDRLGSISSLTIYCDEEAGEE